MASEQTLNHEGRISALEASYQHLATKADIESLRTDFEGLRSEMRSMRWSIGLTVALIVTIINVIVQLALRAAPAAPL